MYAQILIYKSKLWSFKLRYAWNMSPVKIILGFGEELERVISWKSKHGGFPRNFPQKNNE